MLDHKYTIVAIDEFDEIVVIKTDDNLTPIECACSDLSLSDPFQLKLDVHTGIISKAGTDEVVATVDSKGIIHRLRKRSTIVQDIDRSLDHCVVCGRYIPEGSHICNDCNHCET